MHQANGGFYFILKKHVKLSQKIDSLTHFERFLVYTFLRTFLRPSSPQSSSKLKVLWRYIIVVSLLVEHLWLSNYMFSNVFVAMQHPWNGPFLGSFWALPSPNMNRVCWNFDHRYVFHKKNTVSEQSFKIKCLSGNGKYSKLIVLVHFWAQFTPKNREILPKFKTFFQKLRLMTIK